MKQSSANHQATISTAHSVNLQKYLDLCLFVLLSKFSHKITQYLHPLPAKYLPPPNTQCPPWIAQCHSKNQVDSEEVTNTKFQHLKKLGNTTKASVRDIATGIINKTGLEIFIF